MIFSRPPAKHPAEGPQVDAVPPELRDAVMRSGLFDADLYRSAHPDSAADPLAHHLAYGAGRAGPDFEGAAYLEANPDVAAAGVHPLVHYVLHGRAENRPIDPAARARYDADFDADYYRDAAPVEIAGHPDPLIHYLGGGFREGLRPHPGFDPQAYLAANPDVGLAGLEPLTHWILSGRAEGRGLTPGDAVPSRAVRAVIDQAVAHGVFRRTADDATARLAGMDFALQAQVRPDVSILLDGTAPLGTLDSLVRHRSRHSAEILVCGGDPDLAQIAWLRQLDTTDRKVAVAQAQGQHLIFLDSGTRVAEGLLDELVGGLAIAPKAGLIGARVFNLRITLQQAGGILWEDGTRANYGQSENPDDPRYSFARQVDFASTAFLVTRPAWDASGGLATGDEPGLAARLRAAGFETWMQPLACVLSPVRPTPPPPPHPDQDRAANRQTIDRVLVLDATVPAPDRDAGSAIAMRMLAVLQGLRYQLAFVAQNHDVHDPAPTEALQRHGIQCLHPPYARSVAGAIGFHGGFDLVFAFRFSVLHPVLDDLRRLLPQARIVFNTVDLHYLRAEREAALTGSRSGRAAAMVARCAELETIARADCTIVHTAAEAETIRRALAPEIEIDTLVEIPWITETVPSAAGFDARTDVLFLGNFAHTPNVDAVLHFVAEIWPALLPRLPAHARLVLAGVAPTPAVLALANERIIVTGHVVELQPLFDAARVFVAPLRYGAGIKGKVIDSLRRGLPCVISPMAAEGMELAHDAQTLIAAPDPGFADQVARLYADRDLWTRLQRAGYAFVEAHFSQASGIALIKHALDTADRSWARRQEQALRRTLARLHT